MSSKKNIYDVCVVGGGASGMTAAIEAARQGAKVVIFEHLEKPGKKILATGNGKCNYSNKIFTPNCYRGSNADFADKVLSVLEPDKVIDFLYTLGIQPKVKNNYYYPYSENASAVNDALRYELDNLGVDIICGRHVVKIEKESFFKLYFRDCDDTVSANKLILATGGLSGQALGSDGSGYEFAKGFGHHIVNPVPALVQLKTAGKFLKTVAGVRLEGSVTLKINNKNKAVEKGELLFTAYGISGIPILQVSRYASYALLENASVSVFLDFFPDMGENELREILRYRFERRNKKTNEEVFTGLLNKKLVYIILKECNIDPEGFSDINRINFDELIKYLKHFEMKVTDSNGFAASQVTAGGVSADEINPLTMESKLTDNLYFAGEIIDIDGTCGGYNLHWAWTTGIIAGMSAAKSN